MLHSERKTRQFLIIRGDLQGVHTIGSGSLYFEKNKELIMTYDEN